MLGDWVNRKIKWIVRHEDEIRAAAAEKRRERKRRNGKPESRPQGYVSDPTYREAEQDLTPLRFVEIRAGRVDHPEEWLAAIESVRERLSPDDKRILRLVRERKTIEESLAEVPSGKEAFYRRRDRIFAMIALKASEAGLVRL